VDLPTEHQRKLLTLNETQAETNLVSRWSNGSPLSLGKLEGGKVYKVRPNGSNLTQLNKDDGYSKAQFGIMMAPE